MELYSFAFLLFLLVSLLLHEIIGKNSGKNQWLVRLFASLGFYVCIAKWRILFLAISIVSVWLSARKMDDIAKEGKELRKKEGLTKEEKKNLKQITKRKKKVVLFLALAVNLLILIAVKYVMPAMSKSLVLPLGISFYTFMAISYLVDVYGEKYESEGNMAKVALYLTWFPQMLQGPINRFDYVKDSLYGENHLTYDALRKYSLLFIYGAVKKYAIANMLAPSVNEVFLRESLSDLPGSFLLFTALLFAIEQYADFSGGIDMVMAVAGLFGVKMNENFRQPYFSKSISEFWRRWHISLGSFLRDYVFYPFALLPGMVKLNDKVSKRCGKHIGRSVVAGLGNLLVFLLVGLWHGSAIHYIVWGLYNGIIIAVSDFMAPAFVRMKTGMKIKDDNKLFQAFQILRTFMLIVLAGYFDAIPNVANGFICFKNTFVNFKANELGPYLKYLYECGLISDIGMVAMAVALIMVFTISILKENHIDFFESIFNKNIAIRWIVYLLMVYVMLFGFSAAGANGGFMYAAF